MKSDLFVDGRLNNFQSCEIGEQEDTRSFPEFWVLLEMNDDYWDNKVVHFDSNLDLEVIKKTLS